MRQSGKTLSAWQACGFAKFTRNKPHLNIGTVGHIDHGKTTLTSAITMLLSKKKFCKHFKYEEIDRAPEERNRGITINSTTLEYQTEKRHYSHVDCPGHKDYVKNMITGAARMDSAILVVSAADGPMPQTKEHILLCKEVGVKDIVVFLNKSELVKEEEMFELIEMEIQEMFEKYGYGTEKPVFIRGSALSALQGTNKALGEDSVQKLLDYLDNKPLPPRVMEDKFFLSIDNTIIIEGRGTVATGTIDRGLAKAGDKIEVIGLKKSRPNFVIKSIETFQKSLDQGLPGDNVGMMFKGVPKGDMVRGNALVTPGTYPVGRHFEGKLYVLTEEEGGRKSPFRTGFRPQCFVRTADVAVVLTIKGDNACVVQGGVIDIECLLDKPLPIMEQVNFALREGGKTVGTGIITKMLPDPPEEEATPKKTKGVRTLKK